MFKFTKEEIENATDAELNFMIDKVNNYLTYAKKGILDGVFFDHESLKKVLIGYFSEALKL